jgi:putative resolvase
MAAPFVRAAGHATACGAYGDFKAGCHLGCLRHPPNFISEDASAGGVVTYRDRRGLNGRMVVIRMSVRDRIQGEGLALLNMCAIALKYVRHETMLSTGKAADYPGVGAKTLQRWDREGRLKPERTSTGRRIYSNAFMRRSASSSATRVPIAYCRVSSAAQRPDLKNQRRVLEDFCAARGVANAEFVEEVGGGLTVKRPKFVAIMDRSEAGEVSHLIVAHKGCLVRFGFPWFERFCAEHRTAGSQQRTTFAGTGNGSGSSNDRSLLFCATVRSAQLPQEIERGASRGCCAVIPGHKIALGPTPGQAVHCRRACASARYAYNWGLAEWQRMGAGKHRG